MRLPVLETRNLLTNTLFVGGFAAAAIVVAACSSGPDPNDPSQMQPSGGYNTSGQYQPSGGYATGGYTQQPTQPTQKLQLTQLIQLIPTSPLSPLCPTIRRFPSIQRFPPIPRSQRMTPGGPFMDVTRQMVAVDKPIVAAIHGHAVGAGLAYAVVCDRRFGDTTTKISAIFTNVGVAPDCGLSWFLPRVVGLPTALMMVETGKVFKAEDCKALGLIDELVPEGQSFEAAFEYARTLASRATVAVSMARRMVLMGQTATLEQILDYEGIAGVIVASTFDAREGTQSFLESRKPAYRGI